MVRIPSSAGSGSVTLKSVAKDRPTEDSQRQPVGRHKVVQLRWRPQHGFVSAGREFYREVSVPVAPRGRAIGVVHGEIPIKHLLPAFRANTKNAGPGRAAVGGFRIAWD